VLLAGDEVIWVAGLAIAERCKIWAGTRQTVIISADPIRN
jgi:hypothetical protein